MEQKKLTKLMAWIVFPMVALGGLFLAIGAVLIQDISIGQFYTNIPSLVGAGLFFGGVAIFIVFNFFHNRHNGKV